MKRKIFQIKERSRIWKRSCKKPDLNYYLLEDGLGKGFDVLGLNLALNPGQNCQLNLPLPILQQQILSQNSLIYYFFNTFTFTALSIVMQWIDIDNLIALIRSNYWANEKYLGKMMKLKRQHLVCWWEIVETKLFICIL